MKKIVKYIIGISIASIFACACQKSDANKDYGFPLIYIPQATVTGLDNSYPIPNGPIGQSSNYVCKYNEKTGTLDIALGVVRSGYISNAKGFTVKLRTSNELTDLKLDELLQKSSSAVALPLKYCTIPEIIEVAPGKNSGTCYVSIDMKGLSSESLYDGSEYKRLVLGLEIYEPSAYELAQSNTSVVIIVDLNSTHWDNVAENLPESAIRDLFPIY